MEGKFITFEGTDGVGKSTQMALVCRWFEENGIDYIVTREPGGCAVSEKIRAVLLDRANAEIVPETEMLLYAAARAQLMKTVILPALAEGKTVLCDRFVDSSVAYQGYGRELGADAVLTANAPALFGRMPDLTVMLVISPELAFERKHGAHDDRIEDSGNAFFERTEKGFSEIAAKFPERIRLVDASGTKEETHAKVMSLIGELYK